MGIEIIIKISDYLYLLKFFKLKNTRFSIWKSERYREKEGIYFLLVEIQVPSTEYLGVFDTTFLLISEGTSCLDLKAE